MDEVSNLHALAAREDVVTVYERDPLKYQRKVGGNIIGGHQGKNGGERWHMATVSKWILWRMGFGSVKPTQSGSFQFKLERALP